MTRRFALTVLAALVAFAALFGFLALVDPAPKRVQAKIDSSIVVIAAPGLRWAEVTAETYPDLRETLDYGAIGSLNPRGGVTGTCSADAWLSLSAGQGISLPTLCDSPPPVVGSTIKGVDAWRPAKGEDIGLLAERYRAAGRCVAAVGPGAALGAIDRAGRIAHYTPTVADAAYDRCALTLVDASGGKPKTTMADLNTAFAGLPPSATVIVTGLADGTGAQGSGDARLRSLFLVGNSVKHGTVWSASVRQPGVVQIADLTATLLAPLGTVPAQVQGSPLQVAENATPSGTLVRQASALDTQLRTVLDLPVPLFGGWALVGLGLAVLLWRHRSQVPPWLPPTLTLWACFPTAGFLAGLAPWASWPAPALWFVVFSLLFAGVLTAAAYAGRWRRSPIGPVVVVAALTWLVLGLDVMRGSTLQFAAPLGLQPLNGGRFYGMGNVGFALFATSALIAAGLGAGALLARGERRLAAATLALVGAATVIIDGWPGWGADFGGPPAVVVATAVLVLLALGVSLAPRRLMLIALAAVLVAAALALADWMRPAQSRTHLGRFVQQVLDGHGLGVVGDKLGANLKLVFGTPISPLVVIAFGLLIWLVIKPSSRAGAALDSALRCVRFGRATLIGLLVLWAVGFVINDSGFALLLNGIGLAVPLSMALVAQWLRQDQDDTIRI